MSNLPPAVDKEKQLTFTLALPEEIPEGNNSMLEYVLEIAQQARQAVKQVLGNGMNNSSGLHVDIEDNSGIIKFRHFELRDDTVFFDGGGKSVWVKTIEEIFKPFNMVLRRPDTAEQTTSPDLEARQSELQAEIDAKLGTEHDVRVIIFEGKIRIAGYKDGKMTGMIDEVGFYRYVDQERGPEWILRQGLDLLPEIVRQSDEAIATEAMNRYFGSVKPNAVRDYPRVLQASISTAQYIEQHAGGEQGVDLDDQRDDLKWAIAGSMFGSSGPNDFRSENMGHHTLASGYAECLLDQIIAVKKADWQRVADANTFA